MPSTHALVIGVGDYPDAMGRFGITPIASPPSSAHAFADWLRRSYKNPGAPLGTVELLTSATRRPTIAAISAAIGDWCLRCDTDAGNIALFYFCGHGLARGEDLAMLADDFGAAGPPNPLAEALALEELYLGMERCSAQRQCFFIDCCRNEDPSLAYYMGPFGQAPLAFGPLRPRPRPRDYPVYYAAGAGQASFGPKQGVSVFTTALLAALDGLGAESDDDSDPTWEVTTLGLQRALVDIMARTRANDGPPPQDPMLGGRSSEWVLHISPTPNVPVVVGCDPEEHNNSATMTVLTRGKTLMSRPPAPDDWSLSLPAAYYELDVTTPVHAVRRMYYVRPPVTCMKVRFS